MAVERRRPSGGSIVTKSGHDYIIRIFLSSAYAINIPVISGKATSFMTS
jgi:hypothetical protein